MNYCSIEDAWQENNNLLKKNIEEFDNSNPNLNTNNNNLNTTNNLNANNNLIFNNEKCDCDKLIEYVLKCKNCHNKLLKILNKNKLNSIISYLILIIENNRDIIIIILVFLFIYLLLNLINNILF
jgi:hypothetical protein